MSRAGRRDFWCRHHIWHSWESKRVLVLRDTPFFGDVYQQMWVCRRCKMGITMTHEKRRVFMRHPDGCVIPMDGKQAQHSHFGPVWLRGLTRRKS